VLTFITVNSLLVLNVVTDSAIQSLQDKVDVSIYFGNEVKEADILEVKDFLSTHSQIKQIEYVSADDALQKFRQFHQDDATILESLEELDENPLGGTLIVKTEKIADYKNISEILDNSKYNEMILDKNYDDNEQFIATINDISQKVNRVVTIAIIVFTLIVIVVVFNTIRVAIYTHKEEIGIMKLVGANNMFIIYPFLIESVIYAVLALILSIAITYPLLSLIEPYLAGFFQGSELNIIGFFNKNYIYIFGLELIGSIILNIISSGIAIRRYLKV